MVIIFINNNTNTLINNNYGRLKDLIKGRDSSVGIATSYGLDGPGIETRWG